MNNNLLSNHIHTYAYDDNRTILYNSFNQAITLIENKFLNNNFSDLNEEDFLQLTEMGFIDKKELLSIKESYSNFSSQTLSIIIELTTNCNLNCTYCYQDNWEKKENISIDTLDKTATYIKNCILNENYKFLELNLFGGEPLLAKNEIIYIYSKINSICKDLNVTLKTRITTNGVLLTSNFLNNFESIDIIVSLTPKSDHDSKRIYNNSTGTYDTILNNLKNCREIFNSSANLFIRYNTNYYNLNLFESFICSLKSLNIKFNIQTAYTFEHNYTLFKNTLSLTDYKIWNSSTVIDILIKNNLNVLHKPNSAAIPCTGYYKHNIKIFSDGYLGLCNGYFPNKKKFTIDDVYENINLVENLFPEKLQIPYDNKNCSTCKELFLCGGKKFCKEKPCEYGFIDLGTYLKTYIKHTLNNNNQYFTL